LTRPSTYDDRKGRPPSTKAVRDADPWFNEERLHSDLDDRTPAEFEADYRHRPQPDAP